MYITTAPWLLRKFFPPGLVWDIPNDANEIYLTFDDGPQPIATPFVLDCLQKYDAKATFFCIGKNVEENRDIYKRILDEGHSIGNHTYNHLNGKKTDDKVYFDNIIKAAKVIDSNIFRPPYGRITNFQAASLKTAYKVVMWSVLSADFDNKITGEKCLRNVVKNTKPGSVIVFHDSKKALSRLEYALPRAMEFFVEKGFNFGVIKGKSS